MPITIETDDLGRLRRIIDRPPRSAATYGPYRPAQVPPPAPQPPPPGTWIQALAFPLRVPCEWRTNSLRCGQPISTHVQRVACGGVVRWLCRRHGEASCQPGEVGTYQHGQVAAEGAAMFGSGE